MASFAHAEESEFPEPTQRCVSAARSKGARVDVVLFDVELPTAKAAAAQLGVNVGQITNSLVFELKGPKAEGRKPILVCTPGNRRVDVAKLAAVIGVIKSKVKSNSGTWSLSYSSYSRA
jgi:prolyl-tRNA editing enzyme YbaK/EbsC (Cys-tRNA(Pro) deacylase)